MADDDLTRNDTYVLAFGLMLTATVAIAVDPFVTVRWSGPSIPWPLACSRTARGCEPMLLESVLRATVGTAVGVIPLLVWRWRRPPKC